MLMVDESKIVFEKPCQKLKNKTLRVLDVLLYKSYLKPCWLHVWQYEFQVKYRPWLISDTSSELRLTSFLNKAHCPDRSFND